MTLRKPGIAAIAALATLAGGMTIADTAAARPHGGTSFSLTIGNGPGYYGSGYRYGYAPRGYYRPGGYRYARPYYAPPRYGYRYPARYRTCDRWAWDGWRRTYVLVRGRC